MDNSLRLPKSAYRYWPLDSEAMIRSQPYGRRLIFQRQVLRDEEEEQLQRLQAEMDANWQICASLPEGWTRFNALRFLYAAKWDVKTAASNVLADCLWRKVTLPTLYPAFPPLTVLSLGGLYLHGRDHKYRPLIVLRPALLSEVDDVMVRDAGVFLLEFVLEHMLLPGQVESWVLLLDLSNCSDMSSPSIQRLADFFALHYPCRLFNAFVLNATEQTWTSLSAYLDADTAARFILEAATCCEKLWDQFNESQIERRYGGSAPNLDTFWPPIGPKGRLEVPGQEQTLSDYSSFPEYFPERSLTEDSEGNSSSEVLYLSDLLGQVMPEKEEDDADVTVNPPRAAVNERYPAAAILPRPPDCCAACDLM